MGAVSVLVAAAAAWIFGAVWYGALAKPWMAAVGFTQEDVQGGSKMPFVISAVMAILVAGMMRHIFAMAGIDSVGKGLITGLGLGLFVAAPWIVTNYSYSNRGMTLTAIDGGYAAIGCAIMGAVYGLL